MTRCSMNRNHAFQVGFFPQKTLSRIYVEFRFHSPLCSCSVNEDHAARFDWYSVTSYQSENSQIRPQVSKGPNLASVL